MVFVFDLLIYQTTPNRTFIDRYTKVDYSSFKVCGFPFNTSITSITQIQDISGPYIKLLGQLCVGFFFWTETMCWFTSSIVRAEYINIYFDK